MSVYNPLAKYDASYWVNARATYYPRMTEIYVPHQPYQRLEPGMEARNKTTDSKPRQHTSMETDVERSMRRSKKRIKEYIFCNDFDMMATFTFNDNHGDREDDSACRSKMRNWLKSQQKNHGKFSYLIVSELHKDPVAIHYHALFGGFTGRVKRSMRNGRPLVMGRKKVYEFPGYTHGYTTVKMLGESEEDRIRAGFYIKKYITKENTSFFGKNRYWTSRSLKRPITEDNPQEWYFAVTPDHIYPTEYGTVYLFDNKRIEIFLP